MPNKTLSMTAPDAIFDLAVEALWFNGGAFEGDHLERALTRLRQYLRDEISAYQLAQKQVEQQAELEQFRTGLGSQLDAAAEALTLTVE